MAPKHKIHAVRAQPVKQKAKPRGLQLSTAQWKLYHKAYRAVLTAGFAQLRAQSQNASLARRRQAFSNSVQVLRRARLNAAYRLAKKTAAAHRAAQTAAIATYAAKQSYRQAINGHQNAALKARVYANYQRHVQQTARLQYAYQGENRYRHEAVMRTLTNSQAASAVAARQAQAARAGKKALKSVSTSGSAASSAAHRAAVAKIRAQAKAAGLAAAESIPSSKRPVRKRIAHSAKPATRVKQKKHHRRQKRAIGRVIGARFGGSAAAVKPAKKAPRTAPCPPRDFTRPLDETAAARWGFGNPEGYDCVAAAIASHLLLTQGYLLNKRQYARLVSTLDEAPSIEGALKAMRRAPLWRRGVPLLLDFQPAVPGRVHMPLVIGFATARGAHAALLTGNRGYVASWGEILPLASVMLPGTEIEEAWSLQWGK